MTNLTKKELLVIAKEMNIVGRHNMTWGQLNEAINGQKAETQTDEMPSWAKNLDRAAAYAEAKTVKAVEASDEMFSNFIPTKPFRGRPYTVVGKNEEVYKTLPPQAKKIFDFMEESGIVAHGDQIVAAAVEAGKLKTTQDPATLFAFYARKLEDAGIRLAK